MENCTGKNERQRGSSKSRQRREIGKSVPQQNSGDAAAEATNAVAVQDHSPLVQQISEQATVKPVKDTAKEKICLKPQVEEAKGKEIGKDSRDEAFQPVEKQSLKRNGFSDGNLAKFLSSDDSSEGYASERCTSSCDETEESNKVLEELLLEAKQRKKQKEADEKNRNTMIPKKKEKGGKSLKASQKPQPEEELESFASFCNEMASEDEKVRDIMIPKKREKGGNNKKETGGKKKGIQQ